MSQGILIVGNEPELASSLIGHFHKRGIQVSEAANAFHALELIEEIRPQILLLAPMKAVMSETDFLIRLKSTPGLSDLPVVLIGNGPPAESITGLFVSYLRKPVSPERLIEIIESLLKSR